MKKLLTVLLVIAVMFTFSFGSAMAATPNYDSNLAKVWFDKAMDDAKTEGTIDVGYDVDYSVLEAHKAEILDAALYYAKNVGDNYITDHEGIETVLNYADNEDLKLTLVAEQYEADKSEAVAILNGISVSDFSTKEMDPKCEADGHACTTYQDHVKAILADAVDYINDVTFDSDSDVSTYATAKDRITKYFEDYAEAMPKTKLLLEKGYMAGSDAVGLGVYELNMKFVDVTYGNKKLEDYTTDAVNAGEAINSADIAAVKATIASAYANYLKNHTSDAEKTFAANMKKVLEYLADQKIALRAMNTYFTEDYSETAAKALADAIKAVEDFEAQAARLAAETDATGALVRDAEDVADYVTKGTVNKYATTVGIDGDLDAKYIDIATCVTKITGLYASLADAKLAYFKKYESTKLADAYTDAKDDYYAPEYAAYKALVDEYTAKIDAAKDDKEVKKLVREFPGKLNDIKLASVVDAKTVSSGLIGVAETYAGVLNSSLKGDNQYYLGKEREIEKLEKAVKDLVGASEARTDKDIKALSEQVLAMVKTLPTKGAVKAALGAADEAVTALPNGTVTTADKATIDAAKAAIDAYEELSADTYTKDKLDSAVMKYAYASNNEMTAKVKAVVKTDKAAIKALLDEIKAFVDTYKNAAVFASNKSTLEGYLNDIQKTEFDAVKAAIAAIPVKENITEAAKDKVVAARTLYDAYVVEYTNYDFYEEEIPVDKTNFNYDGPAVTTDGFVADDFTSYSELVAAETLLGLNQESPAKAVESLKITARSTAKKGSITVKWTVKGEADIDGYQIWKSKKANSGYKKAFTTTKKSYKNSKGLKKGTRYYYKVRAYKVIDGKNVYSDWSNKANRKAK